MTYAVDRRNLTRSLLCFQSPRRAAKKHLCSTRRFDQMRKNSLESDGCRSAAQLCWQVGLSSVQLALRPGFPPYKCKLVNQEI